MAELKVGMELYKSKLLLSIVWCIIFFGYSIALGLTLVMAAYILGVW